MTPNPLAVGLGPSVNRFDPARPLPPQVDEMVATARAARAAGFAYVCGGHHWLAPGFLSPLLCFARLAGEAPGLGFHTSVFLLPQHNPYDIADQVAALDLLTGGRLVFGVGTGYREVEFAAAGMAKRQRVGRLEEAIGILRALWRGEEVAPRGKYFPAPAVRASVRPVQRPGVPILIGAQNPAGVRRTGRLGDGWIVNGMYTLGDIRAHLPLYLEARRAAGKPGPGLIELKRYVHVAPTRQQALDEARTYIESYWDNAFYRAGGFQESGTVRLDIPWEEAVRERAVVGTPEEVVRALQAMVDEFGATHLALFWKQPGWTHTEYLDAIRLLGREVVPHLRPAATA